MSVVAQDVILIWNGLHTSIPTGYNRETALDGKHLKGTPNATDPGTESGSNTHTHTSPAHSHTLNAHTHTVSLNASTAGGNSTGSTSSGGPSSNHGHQSVNSGAQVSGALSSVTSTYESVNHEPPYHEVIFIKSTGVRGVPTDTIFLFNKTSLPTDYYKCDGNNGTPNLVDKFLKGAGTAQDAGTTGGASTHSGHVISHTHTETPHTHARVQSGAYTATTDFETASGTADSVQSHSHDIDLNSNTVGYSGTPTSGSASNIPVHKKLLALQNKGSGETPPQYMIGLWLGSLASIPFGWQICDGTNGTPDMREFYPRITATDLDIETTGGSNTHTHSDSHTHTGGSHTHTATVEVQSATNNLLNSGHSLPKPHGHTANVGSTSADWGSANTTADSSSNEPAHTEVAFIMKMGTSFSQTFTENISLSESFAKTIARTFTENMTLSERFQATKNAVVLNLYNKLEKLTATWTKQPRP